MRFAVLRSHNSAPKKYRWNETKRCYWCNRSVTYRGVFNQKDSRATREHLIPTSMGGGDGGNRVVACKRCNNKRGRDMSWVPFGSIPSGLRKKAPVALIEGEYVEIFPREGGR